MNVKVSHFLFITGLLAVILLSACNMPAGQASTPTKDAAAIITEAAMTVAAQLTQSAGLTPSPTTAPEQPATAQPNPAATATIATPSSPVSDTPTPKPIPGTSTKPDAASFVEDVTVPDGTVAIPGSVFVKTWRIKNTGTTTWSPAYSLVWVEGDKMGGPDAIPLPHEARPGETVDISVNLTAPIKPGTYQTFFRLRNADGQYFKLDTSGDLWVKIIVGLAATNTPGTETPTATEAP